MKLANLDFELASWTERDFHQMQRAKETLSKLASSAGQRSDAFRDWCRRLMRKAEAGDLEGIRDDLDKPISFRALAYLWRNEDEFLALCPLDREMLALLEGAAHRVSRQGVLMLVGVFLERFDKLGSAETLAGLGRIIAKELERFGQGSGELNLLQQYSRDVFLSEGPARIVSIAMKNNLDLSVTLQRCGLRDYNSSRFVQICRYRYYIETLKVIAVDDVDNPVLHEVVKPQVYEAPGDHGEFLGHEILRVLIDRATASGAQVPEHWQQIVLSIAGDPRVPKGHPKYQRWWQILGEEYVKPVIGWLSRMDLRLFLEIIEDYGRSTHNSDLNRMFPGRKRFLEGLLENGVVIETRLFLCASAELYLKRQYRDKSLPNYATVKSSIHQTLIYLNVGGCHLIEGSHSCKLWIFPQLPERSRISNYGVTHFSYRELTAGLEGQFYAEKINKPYESITHSSSDRFTWENRAITYLDSQGVKLDKHLLFEPNDYTRYRRMYGV